MGKWSGGHCGPNAAMVKEPIANSEQNSGFAKQEKLTYECYTDLILDQENPIGSRQGPVGLLDAIASKSDRKKKKAAQREKEKLARLEAKIKNLDYAQNRCKIKQAKKEARRKDRGERYLLAMRNSLFGTSGGGGTTAIDTAKREPPPSPPICKKCGSRHW